MCFMFSLFPATIFVIIGYFVLFSSSKAQGRIRIFGVVLAIWIFIIASFFPLCGAYVTFSGLCPIDQMMQNVEIPTQN